MKISNSKISVSGLYATYPFWQTSYSCFTPWFSSCDLKKWKLFSVHDLHKKCWIQKSWDNAKLKRRKARSPIIHPSTDKRGDPFGLSAWFCCLLAVTGVALRTGPGEKNRPTDRQMESNRTKCWKDFSTTPHSQTVRGLFSQPAEGLFSEFCCRPQQDGSDLVQPQSKLGDKEATRKETNQNKPLGNSHLLQVIILQVFSAALILPVLVTF